MLTQQYLEERSMSMNTFLATTSQGLARASQSASGEWSVEFLLSEQDVRCLAADPLNSRVIYAGTQGQGVLRSEDGGKTWRSAARSLAPSTLERNPLCSSSRVMAAPVGWNWPRSGAFVRAGSGSRPRRNPLAPMYRRLRSRPRTPRSSWWASRPEQWCKASMAGRHGAGIAG